MNYEEMSDFEINKAVASIVSGEVKCYGKVVMVWNGQEHSEVDFCINPSDAMPILTKNKIGFKWVNGSCTASSVLNGYHESTSGNPLRAAMIVFLMMNGESNGNNC